MPINPKTFETAFGGLAPSGGWPQPDEGEAHIARCQRLVHRANKMFFVNKPLVTMGDD